jgi:hypothetical protein
VAEALANLGNRSKSRFIHAYFNSKSIEESKSGKKEKKK